MTIFLTLRGELMMRIRYGLATVLATTMLWCASHAYFAQEAQADPSDPSSEEAVNQCYLHRELSPERLLRRLSIDLRSHVPYFDEYSLVENEDTVPESIIDDYLDSDAFRVTMRRYHEHLLWTNPYGATLTTTNFAITSTNVDGKSISHIASTAKKRSFRGGNGTHVCQGKPQTSIQPGYQLGDVPTCEPMGNDTVGPYCQEGWVEVHPYWEPNPDTKIQLCAFDAQIAATFSKNNTDFPCDNRIAGNEAPCGCGPNLDYCMRYSTQQDVWNAWREQLLMLVDDYTDGTRPYSELLTTKRSYMNGRLNHYYKHLASQAGLARTYNDHYPGDAPLSENTDWHDQNWVQVDRDEPHAGILTLPAFSLRFQTNRGRANRFRIAFTGEYFQPPMVETSGCDSETEDLSLRCTCRKCHQVLEPLAAYFGKVSEAGSALLTSFPTEFSNLKSCADSALESSNTHCNRFYQPVSADLDPDVINWKLAPLEWVNQHPEFQDNFDAGPAGIATWAIDSGAFARSTVSNLFHFLMKREINLSPHDPVSELELLDEIATEFQAHDNLKLLVKRIVELPQYRRMQ